jgi:uncharacterized membrane protein YhiD involved in acid resistance
VEQLLYSQPFVLIILALISAATTIIVQLIGQRVVKKVKARPPKTPAGYERLLSYMDTELREVRTKLQETQEILDRTRTSLRHEQEKFHEAQKLSTERRLKLLEVSRKYGVDVSGLV